VTQNKLIAQLIIKLNVGPGGLETHSAIPALITNLRVRLGDAQFYETKWVQFFLFIRLYKPEEIRRSMKILAELDDLTQVRGAWACITSKIHQQR
jgi:hypothetical protein